MSIGIATARFSGYTAPRMKTFALTCRDGADWAGRKLLLLMFVLALTQVIANYRESLVLAQAGAGLFFAVGALSLVARKPTLLLGANVAGVANVALLQ